MSGAKFTPGPWVFYADVPSADPDWHIVTTANRLRVLANVHIEPGNRTDEANARLIAAAPDMYEALEALWRQALQSDVNDPANEWGREALGMARAALAKADGTP